MLLHGQASAAAGHEQDQGGKAAAVPAQLLLWGWGSTPQAAQDLHTHLAIEAAFADALRDVRSGGVSLPASEPALVPAWARPVRCCTWHTSRCSCCYAYLGTCSR
jgi:hypothetical protein